MFTLSRRENAATGRTARFRGVVRPGGRSAERAGAGFGAEQLPNVAFLPDIPGFLPGFDAGKRAGEFPGGFWRHSAVRFLETSTWFRPGYPARPLASSNTLKGWKVDNHHFD